MIMKNKWHGGGGGGAVYGLGFVGALIYFLQSASSLGEILLGILKAIIWPGMFVYKIFTFLHI